MIKTTVPTAPVPQSRLERLAHFGGLAGRIAGSLVAEGARQISQGNLPRPADMLLTPANARHVAEKLSQLRGAAMKVGQLLSMDAGDILPAELSDILARLRADAVPMPMSQVVDVMQAALGQEWEQRFKRFSFTPSAAASIGQVHKAVSLNDRQLALKIQYPGIRRSIDNDVDNVARLLTITRLLPAELDLGQLLDEAKRQLHEEADYLLEAEHLRRFSRCLQDTPEFVLPGIDEDLTRVNILAMDYLDGKPIESLTTASQSVRDRVMCLLIDLLLRELFEFHMLQTDPNFANFLFHEETRQIGLIDFGAARSYSTTVTDAYRGLLRASLDHNQGAMMESAEAIGYFSDGIHAHQLEAVMALFSLATEPARKHGRYDFGTSDLARRIGNAGMALSFERGYWHTPPADALFLHRKLGGLYLLAARLRANIDVRSILERHV